jgi:hypothetical protein
MQSGGSLTTFRKGKLLPFSILNTEAADFSRTSEKQPDYTALRTTTAWEHVFCYRKLNVLLAVKAAIFIL